MRWRIISLMMVFVALAHFNRISISVAGTEKIIGRQGIDKQEMGFVYSSYLLLYTGFMIPAGWFLLDRFGPRRAWMVLAFGSAVLVAFTGVVGILWPTGTALLVGLLLVRALLGVVSTPLHPTPARLVANWVPPSGFNLANGLVTGAACVGIAATYPLFGLLIDRFGWPNAFLCTAVITLAVALAWTLLAADYPPGGSARTYTSPSLRSFLPLLSNRNLLLLALAYCLFGYFQYLFFYWAQYYFEKVQELPNQTSREYTAVLTLAMGAGMVVGGWLSDRALARFGFRIGLAIVPVAGLLVAAVAVLCALRSSDPGMILFWLTLAMGAGGMVEGPSWTAAVRIGGRLGGTAAAIMNTGGNAGGLLAPVLTPLISDAYGWHAALGVASAVCLAAAVHWLLIRPEPADADAITST